MRGRREGALLNLSGSFSSQNIYTPEVDPYLLVHSELN